MPFELASQRVPLASWQKLPMVSATFAPATSKLVLRSWQSPPPAVPAHRFPSASSIMQRTTGCGVATGYHRVDFQQRRPADLVASQTAPSRVSSMV